MKTPADYTEKGLSIALRILAVIAMRLFKAAIELLMAVVDVFEILVTEILDPGVAQMEKLAEKPLDSVRL